MNGLQLEALSNHVNDGIVGFIDSALRLRFAHTEQGGEQVRVSSAEVNDKHNENGPKADVAVIEFRKDLTRHVCARLCWKFPDLSFDGGCDE